MPIKSGIYYLPHTIEQSMHSAHNLARDQRHQASGTTEKQGTEEVVVGRRRPRNPLLQEGFKKKVRCTPRTFVAASRRRVSSSSATSALLQNLHGGAGACPKAVSVTPFASRPSLAMPKTLTSSASSPSVANCTLDPCQPFGPLPATTAWPSLSALLQPSLRTDAAQTHRWVSFEATTSARN